MNTETHILKDLSRQRGHVTAVSVALISVGVTIAGMILSGMTTYYTTVNATDTQIATVVGAVDNLAGKQANDENTILAEQKDITQTKIDVEAILVRENITVPKQ